MSPDTSIDQSKPQLVRSPEASAAMLSDRLETLKKKLPKLERQLTAIVPKEDNPIVKDSQAYLKEILGELATYWVQSAELVAKVVGNARQQPNSIGWIEQERKTLLSTITPGLGDEAVAEINTQLDILDDAIRVIKGEKNTKIGTSENNAAIIEEQILELEKINESNVDLADLAQKRKNIEMIARMHRLDGETIEELLEGSEEDDHRVFQDIVGQAEIDPASGYQADLDLESRLSSFEQLVQMKYATWIPATRPTDISARGRSAEQMKQYAINRRDYFKSERSRRRRWAGVLAAGFYSTADVGKALNSIALGISPEDFDALSSKERPLVSIGVQAYESVLHTYLNAKLRKLRDARERLRRFTDIKREQRGEFEPIEEKIARLEWRKKERAEHGGLSDKEKEDLKKLEGELKKNGEKYWAVIFEKDRRNLTNEELDACLKEDQKILNEGAMLDERDIAPNRTEYNKAVAKQRRGEGLSVIEQRWIKSKGQYSLIEVEIADVLYEELEARHLGNPEVTTATMVRFREKNKKPSSYEPSPDELSTFIRSYYGYQVHEAIIAGRTRAVGTLDFATFVANWGILGDVSKTLTAPPEEDIDRIFNGDKMLERFDYFNKKPWVVYGLTMTYYVNLIKKAEEIGIIGKHAKGEYAAERRRWGQVMKNIPDFIELGAEERHLSEKRIAAVNEMVRILEEVTGIEYDTLIKGHFTKIGGTYHETGWRYEQTITEVLVERFGKEAERFIPAKYFEEEKDEKKKAQHLWEIFDLYPILFAELLPKDAEIIAKAHLGLGWEATWDKVQNAMMLTGSFVSNNIERWIDPATKTINNNRLNIERDERLKLYLEQHGIIGNQQAQCLAVVRDIQIFFAPGCSSAKQRQLAAISKLEVQYTLFHSMTPFAYAENTRMGGQAALHRRIVREAGEAKAINDARNALFSTPSPDKIEDILKHLASIKTIEDYTDVLTGEQKVAFMMDFITDVNKHRHLFAQGIPFWESIQNWIHESDNPILKTYFEPLFPATSQAEEWWGAAAPSWLPNDIRHIYQMVRRGGLIARNKHLLNDLKKKHGAENGEVLAWMLWHNIPPILMIFAISVIISEAKAMGEPQQQ